MYWLLVTMSTVGFGEIVPKTDVGRAFHSYLHHRDICKFIPTQYVSEKHISIPKFSAASPLYISTPNTPFDQI